MLELDSCMAVCRKPVIIVHKVINMDIFLTHALLLSRMDYFYDVDGCTFLGFKI